MEVLGTWWSYGSEKTGGGLLQLIRCFGSSPWHWNNEREDEKCVEDDGEDGERGDVLDSVLAREVTEAIPENEVFVLSGWQLPLRRKLEKLTVVVQGGRLRIPEHTEHTPQPKLRLQRLYAQATDEHDEFPGCRGISMSRIQKRTGRGRQRAGRYRSSCAHWWSCCTETGRITIWNRKGLTPRLLVLMMMTTRATIANPIAMRWRAVWMSFEIILALYR